MRAYLGHLSASVLCVLLITSMIGIALAYDCAINSQKNTSYENPFITDHDIRIIIKAL
jgi:hypothetical protein